MNSGRREHRGGAVLTGEKCREWSASHPLRRLGKHKFWAGVPAGRRPQPAPRAAMLRKALHINAIGGYLAAEPALSACCRLRKKTS